MRLIRSLRHRRIRAGFAPLGALYSGDDDAHAVRVLQLRRLNRVWRDISRRSPYYAARVTGGELPTQFESLAQFQREMPVSDRRSVKTHVAEMVLDGAHPDYMRITGGTTAEPLRLPAWRAEDRHTGANAWLARSWFGAGADDRLALLWGHSHLFGQGVRGRLNGTLRRLKDWGFGYSRFSAYDLGEETLRDVGRRILALRPDYLLGYAGALHRLALVNRDRRGAFSRLGLKVAIATGESFPAPDGCRVVAEVLGCPVAMEYGAVETGIIAHQRPSGEYQVFWASHLVEGLPSPNLPGARELLVTALYPRATPLIRYRIGDLVAASAGSSGIALRFDRVVGRSNDGIRVGSKDFVHSETFTHVLRDIDPIQSFQVVQDSDRAITINYTSNEQLPLDTTMLIRRRLGRVDGRLEGVCINRVPRIDPTIAGKSKRVVSAAGPGSEDAS